MARQPQTSKKLAIMGGKPSFIQPVHVNLPTTPNREELNKLINGILDSGLYSNDGPLVKRLEQEISRYLDVKHCVLVSNGTLALQLLIRTLDLKGEVIVPAFTFIATANALLWEGVTPVFCDVKPGTSNIDPEQCKKLITAKTSAILGVHVWGEQCDIQALDKIARENSISLIFDAAHAFACGSESGRMIGSFGDAEMFSFHATKAFHTGEGGAITTDNDELANRLRKARNFGFVDTDETDCLGINGKMSELHAAIGLSNLIELKSNLSKNFSVYSLYAARLKDIIHVKIINFTAPHNFQYLVLLVGSSSPLNRDQLVELLEVENILARRYFYPGCHRLEPYCSNESQASLPETEKLAASTLILPAGASISTQDVDKICHVLIAAFDNAEEIRNQLKSGSQHS